MPENPEAVCASCGKIVVKPPAASPVFEGEKVYHLDCYVLHKRPPPTPKDVSSSPVSGLRIARLDGSDGVSNHSYRVTYPAQTVGKQLASNRTCVGERELLDLLLAARCEPDRARQALAVARTAEAADVPNVILTTERLRELGFTM